MSRLEPRYVLVLPACLARKPLQRLIVPLLLAKTTTEITASRERNRVAGPLPDFVNKQYFICGGELVW
jgi:hypothetical protein